MTSTAFRSLPTAAATAAAATAAGATAAGVTAAGVTPTGATAAAAIAAAATAAALFAVPTLALGQAAPLDPGYTAPRTPYGQPDLQGVWSNAVVTPLERPAELGDQAFLDEQEAAEFAQARVAATNRDRRSDDAEADVLNAYNNFWWDSGSNVVATRRTSLIVDPPDGQVPDLTPAAAARLAALSRRGTDGPEDTGLSTRCIHWSMAGPPMLPGSYNNNYQVVQTEQYVLILNEMGHEARMVPLDGRPRPPGIDQWLGVSRGHWDGDTLIVETTNFGDETTVRGSGPNMRLTERFRRIAENLLLYEFTVDDPESFARPWTVQIPSVRVDELMYEYACHEGNRGMVGILAGARAAEAEGER
jgi:hypothetical protein